MLERMGDDEVQSNDVDKLKGDSELFRIRYILLFSDILICATKEGENLHLDWKIDFNCCNLETLKFSPRLLHFLFIILNYYCYFY